GRVADGAALAIAAWIAAVRRGVAGEDTRGAEIAEASASGDPVATMLRAIDAGLADDAGFTARVRSLVGRCEWPALRGA
ncbi:MAG: hypothetical protein QM604_03265, partial [Microbacterium sp.]